MEDKQLQPQEPELDLEDILKEFGGPDPDAPEEAEATLPVEEPQPEPAQEPEAVPSDTIRLDQIQKAVAAHTVTDKTTRYQPVQEEEAAPPVEAPRKAEPFSEDWEPDYEDPMGDYTPPPIEFKPRSRLQQLRSKLVAGPEKKYYELAEKGFGKLQTGIFLSLILFAVAACTTVLYAMGMVSPERLRLLVYVQILCMLLAGLVGCYRMLDGLGDILKLRFTLNTWLALTFIVCCIDGVMCLQQQRISCCAVFCLEMVMAQMAANHKRTVQMQQMDSLRKASELTALVSVPDYFTGKSGFAAVPGEPEAFMEEYEKPSGPERLMHWYSLISFLVCGMFGLFGVLRDGFATGMQIMAGALLLSMPATVFISMSRPEKLLSKRLHKLGTVLCGWKGVKAVPKKAVFPLGHRDLFPADAVKLNGVKFLGDRSPDTVVTYAASLVCTDGGGLAPLFQQMLTSRGGRVLPVEDFHTYEGGVSGVVDSQPVTLGTMEFMGRMGVQIPKGTKVAQAVCLAIDGQLAGMFAVTYNRNRASTAGLRTLCSYRSLRPILAESDFMLTREFIGKRFHANAKRLILPERQVRQSLQEKQPPEDAIPIALMTKEGLAHKAFAVTGAKVLRVTLWLGAAIHLLGGLIGLAAAAMLTMAGAQHLLTPESLLLYSLIWMVPGFLITQWTRSV